MNILSNTYIFNKTHCKAYGKAMFSLLIIAKPTKALLNSYGMMAKRSLKGWWPSAPILIHLRGCSNHYFNLVRILSDVRQELKCLIASLVIHQNLRRWWLGAQNLFKVLRDGGREKS